MDNNFNPTVEVKASSVTPATPIRPYLSEAGPCPKSPNHQDTKVYGRKGKHILCKCNGCGETWKLKSDHSDPLKQHYEHLIKRLKEWPLCEYGNVGMVAIITKKDIGKIVKDMEKAIA